MLTTDTKINSKSYKQGINNCSKAARVRERERERERAAKSSLSRKYKSLKNQYLSQSCLVVF